MNNKQLSNPATASVSVLLPSIMEHCITVIKYINSGRESVSEDVNVIRLNEFYRFYDVWVDPKDLALYIDNPTCLVFNLNISSLVYWYRFFSLDELKLLCKSHGIKHGNRTKAALGQDLHGHVCIQRCANLVYIFKSLPRQRRHVSKFFEEGDERFQFSYIPPAPKESTSKPETTNPVRITEAERKTEVRDTETPDVDREYEKDHDHLKLPDKDRKAGIIREWQEEMSAVNQRMVVCAACAIQTPVKASVYIPSGDIDLNLLRNDYIPLKALPKSYNFTLYKRAILDPHGLEHRESLGNIRLCIPCHRSLCSSKMPKFALSNWLYYAWDEVPDDIREAFNKASIFDKMLICRARANSITCRFNTQKKDETDLKNDSILNRARKGVRGNILVAPLDVIRMNKVIPPCTQSIRDTMCAVFIGKAIPTRSTIKYYSPVLVQKSRVKLMIQFLLKYNEHYKPSEEFCYSEENLNALVTSGDSDTDETEEKLPNGVHVGYMPTNNAVESTVADYTPRYEDEDGEKEEFHELLMENVGYTEGDDSPLAYLSMKALALERCLQGKPFIASGTGTHHVPDFKNPSILTWLFPHLDPWGIGGFFHPGRITKISMLDQLCHLLKLHRSPFERDPEFAFVFHNVCRKAMVSQSLRFTVSRHVYRKVADDLLRIDPDVLIRLNEECRKNPYYKAQDQKEKNAFKILSEIRTVSKHLPGSDGYKIMMRNEIRALMIYNGTPTLFITINPSDVDHPLVRLLSGEDIQLDDISRGEELSKWQRSLFAAKNPSACAQFFDRTITQFIKIILRYGRNGDGLYGRCSAYYGTVEAQGKGTLHCHMLVWLHGHLSPHELKDAMLNSEDYRRRVLSWMESVISCEFPGSTGVDQQNRDFPRRVLSKETGDPHPGVVPSPSITNCRSETEFWKDFDQFLERILHQFAWHEHQATCWKYLGRGELQSDENCRMGMDGVTREESSLDEETNEIYLRRHHPKLAPYTDVVSFLLQCNMDIKFIGSGEAAKAFLYYVTDYITKASLTVHVGMAALSYAVKQIYTRISADLTGLSDDEAKGAVITAVNSMMGRQEISQPQVMSYLTGGGDHYKSHRFVVLQWGAIRKYCVGSGYENNLCDGVARGGSGDVTANQTAGQDDNGTVSLTLGCRSITASSQYLDYIYRPSDPKFDCLCLYDFISWTLKSSYGDSKERTPSEIAGTFIDIAHPQFSTHFMRCRRQGYVPVILGPTIPNPDRSDTVKEDWARDMLILFKSWRDVSLLKDGKSTWIEAFKSHEPCMSSFHRKVVRNMKALVECSEARDRHRLRTHGRKMTGEEAEIEGDVEHTTPHLESDVNGRADPEDFDNLDPFSVLEGPDQSEASIISNGDILSSASSRLLDMCLPLKMEDMTKFPASTSSGPSTVSDRDLPLLAQHLGIMQLKRKRQNLQQTELTSADHPNKRNRKDDPIAKQTTLRDDQHHHSSIQSSYATAENIIDEMGLRNNERQLKAFSIVARRLIHPDSQGSQLLMHVAGVGGTGKSHIIKAVILLFERLNKRQELLLGAPTGIAAVLINGQTLHSLISLTPNEKRTNVTQLIDVWKYVKFLIVDEVSMIGARFLSQLSTRMRQGKGDDPVGRGRPFGGVNVIFMGDFGQLKPPKQYALFANELIKNPSFAESRNDQGISALNGVFLWRQVRCVVELVKNQRHSEDPEYAAFLDRLRVGQCVVHNDQGTSDMDYLRTRLIENQASNLEVIENFRDAPIIVGSKSLRDLLNVKLVRYHARRAGKEPTLYFSHDFVNRKKVVGRIQGRLWGLPSAVNKEAFGRLPLFIGMKVMITENLAFGDGIVNGSEGHVTDIKYEQDSEGRRYAKVVYVHIPGCGLNIKGLERDVAPIFPVVTRIEPGISYVRLQSKGFSRRQVPLVPAYVYTDYKSQGRTLFRVIVDLSTARGQGVYVMLSRVKSLSGLLILRWFPPNKIYHRVSEELRAELARISEIALNTPDTDLYA